MTTMSLEAFLDLARRDAAVQERVGAALRQPNPEQAVLAVARDAGFQLSASDLEAALGAPLDDRALEQAVGGSSTGTPNEWFSEFRSLSVTQKIKGN